jgi:hypothetical protein
MTSLRPRIAALAITAAIASGAVLEAGAAGPSRPTAPTALVIDAPLAREGRELVDSRLKAADAAVRLPRDATEARTNVRYLNELGYRVVVAGPNATAAADGTGVGATRVAGLTAALAEAR